MSKIIILTLALIAVAAQAFGDDVQTMVARNFASIMMRSTSGSQRNTECFNIYNPKLTSLTNLYESANKECLDTAANSKDAINKEVAPNVAAVKDLHQNICGGFSKCNPDNNDPYSYFECTNGAAGEAITMSYSIQTTSKDRMQYVLLKEQMVTYDKDTCTQKCSNAYVEGAAKVHADLQDCLSGKIPPPEPSPIETTTVDPDMH